jgi:photosystem II stability/assembly factor-like uncharacterized protein
VLVSTSADGGAHWNTPRRLAVSPGEFVGQVSFAWTGSAWAGWLVHDVVGHQGIEATDDTGVTLTPLDSPNVSGVQVLDAATGFAWLVVRQHSRDILRLYATTDGGDSWQLRTAGLAPQILVFTDADDGWAIADDTTWKTADGGRTWQRAT